MNDPKMITIVERLHSLSNNGKLEWSLTDRDDVFKAEIGDQQVQISLDQATTGSTIVVQVFNDRRILIDSISNVDWEAEFDNAEQAFEYFQTIYEHAKFRAYNIGESLQQVLDRLENMTG